MELARAKVIADQLPWNPLSGFVASLAPACLPGRCCIAGSIRRGKDDVGDIEIVAAPDLTRQPRVAFGQKLVHKSVLDAVLHDLVQAGQLVCLKNGEKYKQFATAAGINLDLFLVTGGDQWGVKFLIRTGPSDFSKWCVTPRSKGGALPSHLEVENNAVWDTNCDPGQRLDTPEEKDFFALLGLGWIEPGEREAQWHRFKDNQDGDPAPVSAPQNVPVPVNAMPHVEAVVSAAVPVVALPSLPPDDIRYMQGLGPGIHVTHREIHY